MVDRLSPEDARILGLSAGTSAATRARSWSSRGYSGRRRSAGSWRPASARSACLWPRLVPAPLDRDRPLWAIDVMALDRGRTALVWRLHHAIADGTVAMRMAHALLFDEPEGGQVAAPPAERPPGVLDAVPWRGTAVGRGAVGAARATASSATWARGRDRGAGARRPAAGARPQSGRDTARPARRADPGGGTLRDVARAGEAHRAQRSAARHRQRRRARGGGGWAAALARGAGRISFGLCGYPRRSEASIRSSPACGESSAR